MKDKTFTFTYNKAIEFAMFLLALSSDDLIKFLEGNNLEYDQKVKTQVQTLRQKLTQYMKWELNYFFTMEEFNLYSLGTMIYSWALMHESKITTVEELINRIENTSRNEMMRIFFSTHYYFMNKGTSNRVEYSEDYDQVKLINIIEDLNLKSQEAKQKIIESLESPIETIQRFTLVIKQVYDKIYQPIEKQIEQIVDKKISLYKGLFNQNQSNFTKDLLKTDYDVFSDKVIVHISYFWNTDFWYWPKLKGEELVILGINTNKIYERINPKEKIYNFLKTISDKTRLEIIDLLSERKWYVNELAERLNVSTATTSYHLSRLQDLNIVDFKREDQRFYYYIIKDNLRNYFNEAAKILIKD